MESARDIQVPSQSINQSIKFSSSKLIFNSMDYQGASGLGYPGGLSGGYPGLGGGYPGLGGGFQQPGIGGFQPGYGGIQQPYGYGGLPFRSGQAKSK